MVATIVLIVAGAWIAITLIVLAICRVANRDGKPEDATVTDSEAKPVGMAVGGKTDGPVKRSSPGE
jgi:hypothetical protein